MKISKKGEYGLLALINLTKAHGKGLKQIADVAREEEIPPKFLEQIFLQFTKAGILNSKRGVGGGYALAIEPDKLSLGRIIRLIDGPLAPLRCVSKMCHSECAREETCELRRVMLEVRNATAKIIDQISLADVCRRKSGRRNPRQEIITYLM